MSTEIVEEQEFWVLRGDEGKYYVGYNCVPSSRFMRALRFNFKDDAEFTLKEAQLRGTNFSTSFPVNARSVRVKTVTTIFLGEEE